MTVKLNAKGYEALRERSPVIEWYAELQTADGSAACARYALATHRTSAAGVTPMTFSLPVTGADVTLPCQIEQVQLFEAASGGDPLSAAEKVEPLLLVLAADAGAVVLTITLPAVV
ncbi:hypothetical protein [Methanoculleus virus Blf4]|uniref:Uncharacterized protein n=1 Tax=Methanoculleus virus Blf4 TaxID=3070925 RepID=A0AA48X4Z6_9CAUD|nr:hypothetical protein QIT39_gp26 [Methanoculleus virus L4768]QXM18643.1 hypothetical protein [Methanoculleus virus Blf4]